MRAQDDRIQGAIGQIFFQALDRGIVNADENRGRDFTGSNQSVGDIVRVQVIVLAAGSAAMTVAALASKRVAPSGGARP